MAWSPDGDTLAGGLRPAVIACGMREREPSLRRLKRAIQVHGLCRGVGARQYRWRRALWGTARSKSGYGERQRLKEIRRLPRLTAWTGRGMDRASP
jgi:hypothetical protein